MTQQAPKRTKRQTKYKNASVQAEATTVELIPKNENQKLYIDAINTASQIIGVGFSGTGKTYIAATAAANAYAFRTIDKIIITRPNVAVGKELGHLPGTMEEKFAPWAAPVMDVLEQQLTKGVVETAIKNGNIQMVPLSYMRGRSFDDAFIICDESQNLTVHEIKMLLTRIGENSKVIINGDIKQSDIKEQSGLSKIIHMAKKYQMNVPIIEFGVDDIVRSEICKAWVVAFMAEGL